MALLSFWVALLMVRIKASFYDEDKFEAGDF